MRHEDLEKILENLKVPELKLKSHKRRLKMALLSSLYFREKSSLWSRLKAALNYMEKQPSVKFMPAGVLALAFIILLVGLNYQGLTSKTRPVKPDRGIVAKVDDWKFKEQELSQSRAVGRALPSLSSIGLGLDSLGLPAASSFKLMGAVPPLLSENLGFSTGGAKDVNNFRENIKNGYLPLSSSLTYEGLFYDYYFDPGQQEKCAKLFCPSYSAAVSKDPFSGTPEYYLNVGLNSNIKQSDFKRKKLNLVVVLDISDSMGEQFNRYYYDQFKGVQPVPLTRPLGLWEKVSPLPDDKEWQKNKIGVASESIVAMLKHLNPDDRFGMAVFDDNAYLAKGLSLVGETDMEKIQEHILALQQRGGTNMEAGIKEGAKLFNELRRANAEEYENRIIFLTDAQPNTGDISESGFIGLTKKNADDKIYMTFIGIGVDFNTDLIEKITKIRGANYYAVHSSQEFKERMDAEFEYMVTPLVFNLNLALKASGYQIEKVYGSPEANEATGEIMKVNTLFPSKTKAGETKGGIVLLKLKKIGNENNGGSLTLSASYEDRSGKTNTDEVKISLGNYLPEYFANTGIRKGVLLTRYANLLKNWMIDERKNYQRPPVAIAEPMVNYERGIILPPDVPPQLSPWEQQSIPLSVALEYRKLFTEFKAYFDGEAKLIGDTGLLKEIEVLQKLSGG